MLTHVTWPWPSGQSTSEQYVEGREPQDQPQEPGKRQKQVPHGSPWYCICEHRWTLLRVWKLTLWKGLWNSSSHSRGGCAEETKGLGETGYGHREYLKQLAFFLSELLYKWIHLIPSQVSPFAPTTAQRKYCFSGCVQDYNYSNIISRAYQ